MQILLGGISMRAYATAVGVAALVAAFAARPAVVEAARVEPATILVFLVATVALQLLSVDLYGGAGASVGAIGVLAAGFAVGPEAAVAAAVAAALLQWARKRSPFHRFAFNAGAL